MIMFKNGRIYKLLPEEIKSIHYIYAKNGKEAIDKAYARIKKEWGSSPDFLFNCELFNIETREPQSSVVEKGKIHLLTDGHGISFVDNKKPVWSYMNNVKAPDYVGVYPTLVRNGIIQVNASPSGLEGSRGRTAIGVDRKNCLYIALVRDGYNDATLHELAEGLTCAGATNGGNLDGGGSSQWITPDDKHRTNRPVRGYIGIWLI
jgi:hypothetical protein